MLSRLAPRLTNMLLRSLSTGSKFALVVVLAKLLEPSEVGLYGLFVATVGFSMLVIGGEYYTYSQRELLTEGKSRWSFVLQHQTLATAFLYAVLLPSQLLIFLLDLVPRQLIMWFFALLVTEHIAQEINRLLIAMHRQLLSSIVLFVRTGAWVWGILPIMWLYPVYRKLEAVLAAWLISCIFAIVIGAMIVWQEVRPWKRWPINWRWLKKGFKVGLLLLIATMCFRALQTFDRYAVEALAGPEFLGVYVLYIGMAMAVVSALDPSVVSFLYPKLVSAHRQGKPLLYRKLMRELAWSSLIVSLLVAATISILAPWVMDWIGKPLYAQNLHVLWLLLVMTTIYAVGMVPHYGLYAHSADKVIVFAHISSLVVFGMTLLASSPLYPREATAISLIAALAWMGLYKYWRYRDIAK
jgi:O-antigen/teichoic acid export membrane protein